jgi:serine/threonine protein kinase
VVSTDAHPFPRKFGKYELLERVGDGGMAEVFRARLPGVLGFEKIVVIKKILPHLAKKRRFVDMFVAEAKLAAEVQHKNVVQVFELGQVQETGDFYMAMEFVHGTDLRHVLGYTTKKNLRLPAWFSVYVVTEILEGLHFAHMLADEEGRSRNIVHRDVTPSNIFISNKGEVKLGDFGVARDDSRESKTRTGQLKGKIGYMSPEQVRSLPVDSRTDVFAVGILLWECLAQRRLFKGRSDFEAMTLICNAPRTPPSSHASDIPPALDKVVLSALDPSLERRIQSAREMQAMLLAILPTLRPIVRASDVEDLVRSIGRDPGQPGAMLQHMTRPTGTGSFSAVGTPSPPTPSAPEMPELEFEDSDSGIEAPAIPPGPQLPGFPPATKSPAPTSGSSASISTSGAAPVVHTSTSDVQVIVGNPAPRERGPSTRIIQAAVDDAARLAMDEPVFERVNAYSSGLPVGASSAPPTPPTSSSDVLDVQTFRPGLEVREHRADASEAERQRWASYGLVNRAYDGACPYWVKNHEGYLFGPVSYDEALTVVKAESLASFAHKALISGDGTKWMDLVEYARLTGQPMLLRHDEERMPAKTLFHGNLATRSMTSVIGALAHRNATGRLYVTDTAHQARASREIDVLNGKPTSVYAHSPNLQLPRLLVSKRLVPEAMMPDLMHRTVTEGRMLDVIAGEKVGVDLSKYHAVFMKDRMVDIFDWPAGRFAFDEGVTPPPSPPFARSLFALLMEMVGRKFQPATLRQHLREAMEAKFKAAETFEQRVPELGLTPQMLDLIQKLLKGKKLSALLKKEDEKMLLTVTYVMLESDLIRKLR